MPKIKVLLIWTYARNDLMKPFLSMLDRIEITGLYYSTPADEIPTANKHLFRQIYWADYSTPSKILNSVKPDMVIFMGIDSLKTIALRIACADRSIPTYFIEHGIKNDLLWIEKDHHAKEPNKSGYFLKRLVNKGLSTFSTLYFALSTVTTQKLYLLKYYLRLSIAFIRYPVPLALARVQFIDRYADRYFFFAPFQVSIHREHSNLPENRVKIIGSLFFDEFFTGYHTASNQPPLVKGQYILLIDQPVEGFALNDKEALFKKLSERSGEHGFKLAVKFHPDDYINPGVDGIIERHPEIEFFKATNVTNLAYYSSACFGYFSTLLMGILCFKPCFVFDFFDIPFVKDWVEMKVVQVTNEDLSNVNFQFNDTKTDPEIIQRYIDKYLFKTDGLALERLKAEIFS